jgi:hypothetical protein
MGEFLLFPACAKASVEVTSLITQRDFSLLLLERSVKHACAREGMIS